MNTTMENEKEEVWSEELCQTACRPGRRVTLSLIKGPYRVGEYEVVVSSLKGRIVRSRDFFPTREIAEDFCRRYIRMHKTFRN